MTIKKHHTIAIVLFSLLLSACSSQKKPCKFVPPQLLEPIVARYPSRALESGAQGAVRVQMEVNEQGKATQVTLLKQHHDRDLNVAALKAVKQAQFKPATCNNKPIKTRNVINLNFQLR